MTRPGRLILMGRHRPHEVLLLVWSLVVGVLLLAGGPAPGSVTSTIPGWEVTVWAGGLALSGATGLISFSRRWRIGVSLRMEMAAQFFGAGTTLVYAGAVFAAAGVRGFATGMLILSWCAANLWRIRQIRRDLREIAWMP